MISNKQLIVIIIAIFIPMTIGTVITNIFIKRTESSTTIEEPSGCNSLILHNENKQGTTHIIFDRNIPIGSESCVLKYKHIQLSDYITITNDDDDSHILIPVSYIKTMFVRDKDVNINQNGK